MRPGPNMKLITDFLFKMPINTFIEENLILYQMGLGLGLGFLPSSMFLSLADNQ